MNFNSTQITISFQTDNDQTLLSLLFLFWLVKKFVYRIVNEVLMIKSDFVEAINFATKIFTIGLVSLVWGVL